MQANEAIKVLSGVGQPLVGKLFLFDAATGAARTISLPPQPPVEVTELIDYQAFCTPAEWSQRVSEISPSVLRKQLKNEYPPLLIDVREPYERAVEDIGGHHIPLGKIADAAPLIEEHDQVVLYCRSGKRSAKAVRQLQDKYGFQHLSNLRGGILAFLAEKED